MTSLVAPFESRDATSSSRALHAALSVGVGKREGRETRGAFSPAHGNRYPNLITSKIHGLALRDSQPLR